MAPTITSEGQWTPKVTRETPTKAAMLSQRPHNLGHRTANAAAKANTAVACPDGKDRPISAWAVAKYG